MATPRPALFSRTTLFGLLLPMTTIALGLQMLRVLFPSLAWYLKDTVGVGSVTLAGYAFATFLVGFLAAGIRRLAGPRLSLWLTAGGLAVLRLVEQIVTRPSVDLWLSMAGSALFVLFLPIWVGHIRAQAGEAAAPRLAYGLILGLALDSAVKGATGTLDLSWVLGSIPLLVMLVWTALVLVLCWREPIEDVSSSSESSWGATLPLLALGPYLMIEAVIFQSQGWVAEVARVGMPEAFLFVMLGNVLAVVGLTWGFARPGPYRPWLASASAVFLTLAVMGADRQGMPSAFALGFGQFLIGWGWSLVAAVVVPATRRGIGRATTVLGLGMILFLLLSFLYYVSIEIALPIPRSTFLPTGAVLVGLGFVYVAIRTRRVSLPSWGDKTALWVADVMVVVPLAYWAFYGRAPVAELPSGLPIRVMTYNIHSAYNSDGRQDPEAIARVIQESGAGVVALQEVSRGWLIDGSTDLAGWLSHRLDMPFIFRGTTDPVWGNAILSKYPILIHGWGRLPLAGTLLARGFLWAQMETGGDEPLLVIASHLHHIESEHAPRLAQVPVLLGFWDGRPSSLLMGDMNSEPGYPEMDLIADAGFVDTWAEAGSGQGLSWPSIGPFERIDWIWHTPDLKAIEAETIATTASDHLPVVATLNVAR